MVSNAEENTFIKAYEDMEKSKTPIRGPEAFPLLEIVQGPKQGAWFTVAYQKEITLGRAATNSILLEDNSVSRSHSVLESAEEGGFTLRDIGSRNGTFLNGKKIQGQVPLKHMDTIKIGIYTLRYLTEPTEESFEQKEEATPQLDETEEPEGTPTEMAVAPEVPEPADTSPEVEMPTQEEAGEAEVPETVVETPPETEPETAEAEAGAAVGESTSEQDLAALVAQEEAGTAQAVGAKAQSRVLKTIGILVAILLVLGAGSYGAYRLGLFDKLKVGGGGESKTADTKEGGPDAKPEVIKPDKPAKPGETVPIFLEVSAEPLQGKVFYKGKELGQTPFKISLQVPAGKPQELSAEFFLEDLDEKITAKQTFQIQKQDEVAQVKFQPQLGALKISALPKTGELYLEGKFAGEQGPAKAIQLEDINFDTPVYLPHGNYVAEIRVPQELEGTGSTVDTVRFRREFSLSPESGEFELSASDEAIKTFPAQIDTKPTGAELLVDGKKVGETPFKGDLPTGRHTLSLKKEGFNDYEKEITIEMNTPYVATFNLDTSPAGEFVNQGRQFLKKGQTNEAIEKLAEALKRNPEPTELGQIHMLLGEAFLQSKTYDQSLAYFQKASERPELSKKAKLGMAEAQAGLGQKAQALIQVVDVFLNTRDEQLKSQAETVYKRISPMKSVLYVTSEPTGAQVTINGNAINQTTPVILSDLMVGSYRVTLNKPGFKTFETKVTLPLSTIKPVIVKLEGEQ